MMLKYFRRTYLVTLILMLALFIVRCPKKDTPLPTPPTPPKERVVKPPTPRSAPVITPDEPDKVVMTDDTGKTEELPPAPAAPPEEAPPEEVTVEKLDTIYFDFDKSNIRSDAQETLSHNA